MTDSPPAGGPPSGAPAGSPQLPPQLQLLQMINGARLSQIIHILARLGVADLLADGPLTSAELAQRAGVHARSLYRVLRAAASLGIFAERADGSFELTPMAEHLRSDAPRSLRAMAMMYGDHWHWRSMGHLIDAVREGQNAFRHVYGTDAFPWLAEHPEQARTFDQAMTSLSSAFNPPVLASYDFSDIETLVDVGGGHGTFLAALLRVNPSMHGVLYDQPEAVATARPVFESAGVADRVRLVGGSFFESVPPGGDAYVLKNVIHDWDDQRAGHILRRCAEAMRPGTRLLVIEMVIDPGNEPFLGKLLDVTMLVIGGQERTEPELRDLLEGSGFRLQRSVRTPSPMRVVEAVRK